MKPIPFTVGIVFVAAGAGSVLLAGNGLAAVAFACGAIAIYIMAGEFEVEHYATGGPRRRVEPWGPDTGEPDGDPASVRFRPRDQRGRGEPSVLSSDPGLRLAIIAAAVAVGLASLAYAARFVAEQRALSQAVELVQTFTDELNQAGEAAQRDIERGHERARTEAAARQRAEAIRRDQAMPFYPPPAQVSAGQRACVNGTALLREPNGWSEVRTSSGRPQPCRDRR